LVLGSAAPAFAAPPPRTIDRPGGNIWRSDAYWTRDFAVPGVDGAVTVAEASGSDLFVGGFFSQADGIESPQIAWFDGRGWIPFPWGSGNSSTSVPSAMLADGGSVVIAGSFPDASSRQRYPVVRWTRAGVTPVGDAGMQGQIVRMFRWNGDLVVAGDLRFANPAGQFFLARLAGNRWVPFGPEIPQVSDSRVMDALPFQGRIVIGGAFRDAGGLTTRGLIAVQGNGTIDTLLDDPDALATRVDKLEIHDGRLIAAGQFELPNDPVRTARSLVAWDGVSVTGLDDEFVGIIASLRSTPNGLYVGGSMNVTPPGGPFSLAPVGRLRGTHLEVIGGLEGTSPLTLAWWAGRIVAGGRRMPTPSATSPYLTLAAYDGARWRSPGAGSAPVAGLDGYIPAPGYASTRVFLEANGQWFAGGQFDVSWHVDGWHPVGPVARWSPPDGWVPFGAGATTGTTTGLAWYQGKLYATGDLWVLAPFGNGHTRLMRSDGSQWSPVDGIAPDAWTSSLVVFGDRLIVGGQFVDATSRQTHGLVEYDGTAVIPSTMGAVLSSGGIINAMLVHEGSLYVAGRFDSIGGIAAQSIARWDGQQWSALADGYSGSVQALAVHDGRIAAGGYPNPVVPPDENIRLWDGRAWIGVKDAPYDVRAMVSRNGILFVGGGFGGSASYFDPDGRLRAWDGREWHALGSGLQSDLFPFGNPSVVTALAFRDNVLWVGGGFTRAGRVTAMNVATWTGFTLQGRPQQRFLTGPIAITPNPSRPGKTIDFVIAGKAPAEVGIYDLAGRRLHMVSAAPMGDGAAATWDGRDADGREVPAGIYFARVLREGRVVATQRLVRLP
jgi:hypothetical protein